MAYIRVPTGQKIISVTAKRLGFIYYECAFCKDKNLAKYELSQTASGMQHVLQKKEKKEEQINSIRTKAAAMVEEKEQKTLQAINEDKDYSVINQKIVCPHCQKKQEWSGIPCPWKETSFFDLWIIGLCFLGIFLFVTIFAAPVFSLIPIVALAGLAALPLIRKKRRKAATHIAEKAEYVLPHFYSSNTIHELIGDFADSISNSD